MSRWELPASWVWVRAEEIADIVSGGTPSSTDPDNFDDNGYPWITPADLSGYSGKTIARGARSLSEQGLANCGAQFLPPGSVLFTSRAPIGYCVVAKDWATTNQGFKNLVLKKGVNPFFVRHYLLASKAYAESLASGSTFKELSGTRMRELEIPLAPLKEQRRIVAKIDALQSRSRRARTALELLYPLLEKSRESLLGAAFRGDLTAGWRNQNTSVEHASVLLKRIHAERRRRWEEAQLAKIRSRGKEPAHESWKDNYREPSEVDEYDLPAIPDTWEWTSLDTIALLKGGLLKGKRRSRGENLRLVPYLRVANVQRGYLDLREILQIEATEAEIEDLRLEKGDILFNEGGDRDKLGRGWVWEGQLPECIHQNHVFRARLIDGDVFPRIISHYANSQGRAYFFDQGRQTTNLASISLAKLRSFPVPLIPPGEAKQIDSHLAETFAMLGSVQSLLESTLQRLDGLDKSILEKAFRGELVAQESSDQPAAELLKNLKRARKSKRHPEAADKIRRLHVKETAMSDNLPIPETHLRDTVQSNGGSMEPRALWKASFLAADIDTFYAQLRREIMRGLLRETRVSDSERVIELV